MITDLIIFQYNYLFLFAILFLLGIVYYIARQFINWGLDRGFHYFLGYIFGSIVFLNFFFLVLLITDQVARTRELLPLFLQIVGIFGVFLLVWRGLYYVVKKQ